MPACDITYWSLKPTLISLIIESEFMFTINVADECWHIVSNGSQFELLISCRNFDRFPLGNIGDHNEKARNLSIGVDVRCVCNDYMSLFFGNRCFALEHAVLT